jgi:hypothetical protein
MIRHELAEFNINVILIEPGAIGSNFVDNIKTAKGFDSNNSPHAKAVQQIFQAFQPMLAHSSHPTEVAHSKCTIHLWEKMQNPSLKHGRSGSGMVFQKRKACDA